VGEINIFSLLQLPRYKHRYKVSCVCCIW